MRKRRNFLLFLILLSSVFAFPARAADVTIIIPNVASDAGVVRVFVCAPEEFLGQTCKYKTALPARTGQMTLTVKHVPPGTYAIQAYHDENNNGKVDFGFLGIFPIEGYALSRMGRMYSEPEFSDVALRIDEPKIVVNMPLNYP